MQSPGRVYSPRPAARCRVGPRHLCRRAHRRCSCRTAAQVVEPRPRERSDPHGARHGLFLRRALRKVSGSAVANGSAWLRCFSPRRTGADGDPAAAGRPAGRDTRNRARRYAFGACPQKKKSSVPGSPIGQRQVRSESMRILTRSPFGMSMRRMGSGSGSGRRAGSGRWAGLSAVAPAVGRIRRPGWVGSRVRRVRGRAARCGVARPESPRRCTLPMTALRVTPWLSRPAIWLALRPSFQSFLRSSTRSSVHDSLSMTGALFLHDRHLGIPLASAERHVPLASSSGN